MLAADPRQMAMAVQDMEEVGRYMLYGMGILVFFVWLLIRTR